MSETITILTADDVRVIAREEANVERLRAAVAAAIDSACAEAHAAGVEQGRQEVASPAPSPACGHNENPPVSGKSRGEEVAEQRIVADDCIVRLQNPGTWTNFTTFTTNGPVTAKDKCEQARAWLAALINAERADAGAKARREQNESMTFVLQQLGNAMRPYRAVKTGESVILAAAGVLNKLAEKGREPAPSQTAREMADKLFGLSGTNEDGECFLLLLPDGQIGFNQDFENAEKDLRTVTDAVAAALATMERQTAERALAAIEKRKPFTQPHTSEYVKGVRLGILQAQDALVPLLSSDPQPAEAK